MSKKIFGRAFKRALTLTASASIMAMAASAAHALPGRDDISPVDNVDTANVWAGVGMMYNAGAGTVCTGQLVNSRTVIFAAHCTDSFFDAQYGAPTGGVPMAFGFGVNALPGFIEWFGNGFQTDESLQVYNVLQIQSVLDAGAFQFPGADVVMATLDSPAIGLPTYGMLFSPLTESTPVSMVGYGGNGNGSLGPVGGIDWQRRAGTNMLDGLFSQDDFIAATFALAGGEWASIYPQSGSQLLYHTDFDRPDRNANDCSRGPVYVGPNDYTCATPPFTGPITWDFTSFFDGGDHINWYGGDATERESGTAGGDSGGGLFVEISGRQLVTGVLSGGWTFTSPAGGYGDVSYYNPLFLYQNWILSANPMVYASAVAGDGNWSDASHWQQDLDPNYFVLDANGNAVNGLNPDAPTSAVESLTTQDDRWGTILDTNVDDITGNQPPAPLTQNNNALASGNPTAGISSTNNIGFASLDGGKPGVQVQDGHDIGKGGLQVQDSLVTADNGSGGLDVNGSISLFGDDNTLSLPPLGWVPNNDWGSFGTWTGPADGTAHFYDVILGNAGTTTVDMDVELDMFTIANIDARLVIPETYTFNTLIAFNHTLGVVELDGQVNAREYMLTSGVLTGHGTLNTMTLWNVAGGVAPGRFGQIGDFDLMGDYVQTAAGSLWIDIGPNGESDLLAVTGDVSLDGMLMVTPTAAYTPRYGDTFTFLTANSIIGDFASVSDLPGVLRPVVNLTSSAAVLELSADSFASQTTYTNAFQSSLGNALDAARDTNYDALSAIYGRLDLLSGDVLAATLDSLSPFEAVMLDRSTRVHSDTLNEALMGQIRGGGGSTATDIAVAMQSAELQQDGSTSPLQQAGAKMLFRHNHGGGAEASRPGLRAFAEVGVLGADADLIQGAGTAELDGEFSLFGLEATFDSGWSLGAAFGFASSEMDRPASLASITSKTSTTQFSVFTGYQGDRMGVSGFVSVADSEIDADRAVLLGSAAATVAADLEGDSRTYGIAADYRVSGDDWLVQVVPTASIVSTRYDYDAQTVRSTPALNIAGRSADSTIARIGANLSTSHSFAGFMPVVYIGAATDYGDESETYSASFQAAPTVSFGTTERIDVNSAWYEFSIGIEREFENGMSFSLGAFTEDRRKMLDRSGASIGISMPF